MRIAREIVATRRRCARSSGARSSPAPGADDLEDDLRRRVELLYHPVGTCRMGTDDESVVDEQLRVRGVEGLRVADASIMPLIPGGNTNAPAIMVGERAADLDPGPRARVSQDHRPGPARRRAAGVHGRDLGDLRRRLEEIQVDIRERLATHPEFGPLSATRPSRPGAGGRQPRALLRAAMIDGAGSGYWDNTRAQAAGYANAEIPLASWVELVQHVPRTT